VCRLGSAKTEEPLIALQEKWEMDFELLSTAAFGKGRESYCAKEGGTRKVHPWYGRHKKLGRERNDGAKRARDPNLETRIQPGGKVP